MRTPALATISTLSLVLALASGCDTAAAGSTTPADASVYADLGIVLPDIDDDDYSIVSHTQADLHLLVFWATYCAPVIGELAEMQAMVERLDQVQLYAISIDGPDTVAQVPGIVAREGWTFPVLFDSDTSVLARWNPKGDCPFYVVLDADGQVLSSHQGYVKGDMVGLEQFLVEQREAASPEAPG